MWLPGAAPSFEGCHGLPVPLNWQSWDSESRLGRWRGGQLLVLLLAADPFSCWDTRAALLTDLLLVPVQGLAPWLLPGYPEK